MGWYVLKRLSTDQNIRLLITQNYPGALKNENA